MKVLFAAGGTGGHIYPAIAVAKELERRDSTNASLFVGTARGMETRIVPESGFQLSLINSAGLKSVGLKAMLKGLAVMPKSFVEARQVIKQFRPHVVVGAGGYVSGPVLMMASVMGLPTIVMDSNALPGFTNRRLARFVDRAALTFEEALPYFGKKGIVIGNPVRKEFFEISAKQRGEKTHLLIFGGSQGARAINNAVTEALEHLAADARRLTITHQTGEGDFEKLREVYSRSAFGDADVRPFIADMFVEFEKADLVICRAGATTCAELAAAGKAAIMIPLPSAADDHQRKNAEALERAGAARVLLQRDMNGAAIAALIKELINSPDTITTMENAAKGLGRKDAAERVADLIEELKRNV
ncbi:MAG TPA: undecaprenyldiphospho-muramoylpentapeptide beta-N-acetylglucosaminyltransferase [Pyrinomonadaceae bacterium]|nr:undecaprenyldiphospho-muramoylpentapeptide beta-N-acetylglucosaminyltransferase [Pyrinomonadaceae bacterium]HMP67064.1 undecaprenyldiphospho-muramoylpentapeptide beta-N-acetylglucosaminyltransferase [Pyrinomonadaceae bacterium]